MQPGLYVSDHNTVTVYPTLSVELAIQGNQPTARTQPAAMQLDCLKWFWVAYMVEPKALFKSSVPSPGGYKAWRRVDQRHQAAGCIFLKRVCSTSSCIYSKSFLLIHCSVVKSQAAGFILSEYILLCGFTAGLLWRKAKNRYTRSCKNLWHKETINIYYKIDIMLKILIDIRE